ncbi:MAG: tRNA (N(6)-L-threonylcarbamoyladenosine(37)-C(2))-methylthiotransferase MtaB [Ruminococcus sp.]|nr:tRNA (N(6)-L-threonylcarbamoyladenosine(37)-C(2))-methylthiotransferase MtaB [Ruminococcus sp.]
MYKVYFITFGCKVSQYETECLRSDFISHGFEVAQSESEADVFFINSCTVTGSGDKKSLYTVRRLRRIYPDSVIILTGCLPQSNEKIDEICPEADIITGTKDRDKIVAFTQQALAEKSRIIHVPDFVRGEEFEEIPYESTFSQTRAFMKIQDGCNCFCSYCIIPFARGRCRSKPVESVKTEAQSLAEAGHREIVLVGINLAFYGMEFGLRLVDAVEICCNTEGIDRVRLGSIEPEMLTDEDLKRLSALPQFCPQFHLSLQSGSAAVLKRMNRKYTPDEYYEIVEKIRSYFPDAAFTTDIMVGFPEETEEEFAESLAFVEKVGFSVIHVFQYSPRKGTPAAAMKQFPKKIKEERADRMKAAGERLSRKYLENLVGKTVPVLFERENSTEFHQGHAPDHTIIKVFRENSKKCLRNSIFYVIIEECSNGYCIGRIADENYT